MTTETYNCKKCGLSISSTCSKCDRVVDVKVLDDGCIVQTKNALIVQMYQLSRIFVLQDKFI